ncbi:hypothetical protein E3N88_40452 [Mikania micrantha]|uniref:Integrase catalytic domain-containing protein n=1 Tax=Mikania micrantha TaxID=192012 RepID=A0A5N6LMS4_9ASTR|nr:hypothetical protein E3N88_40452 [Mikania micrantha]
MSNDLRSWFVTFPNGIIPLVENWGCSRICKDITLQMLDLKLTQDYYPFSIGGADVVLGIQWLYLFNTIQAKWNEMFLIFTIEGKKYKLQGVSSGPQKSATFQHLAFEPETYPSIPIRVHSLIHEFEEVFQELTSIPPFSLNKITIRNKYPIPTTDELLDELNGATVFSKLDLRSVYYQIRVDPADIEKTAFRSHFGHYEFKVMPFGLTNAPSTSQAIMNDLFRPYLRHFIMVFFDDILVYSPSMQQHLNHLQTALELLKQNHFYAKITKCCFGQSQVLFLGHIVSSAGVQVDQDKVRFVRNYGIIARPLTQLTKKDGFVWSEATLKAFTTLKEAIMTAPILCLPEISKSFTVEWDASSEGVGAILTQDSHPVAYFSKSFSHSNRLKSAYDRELLALVLALIQQLEHDPSSSPCYSFMDRSLYFKGKLVVPNFANLRERILHEAHATPTAGHGGFLKTWKRPLPIPQQVWEDKSLDFITGLPSSNCMDTIMVVVDKLSKYAHFLALSHPFTAKSVASLFCNEIVRLHGFPRSIVSDRGKLFLSNFWQELFRLSQTTLKMSYHSSTGLTPFFVVYGRGPPRLYPYEKGETTNVELESQLLARDDMLKKVGAVAYELELPSNARIHPVFHVSVLKPARGYVPSHIIPPLPLTKDWEMDLQPKFVLSHRWVLEAGVYVLEQIIEWQHRPMEEATWESYDLLATQFPLFRLEDKVEGFDDL